MSKNDNIIYEYNVTAKTILQFLKISFLFQFIAIVGIFSSACFFTDYSIIDFLMGFINFLPFCIILCFVIVALGTLSRFLTVTFTDNQIHCKAKFFSYEKTINYSDILFFTHNKIFYEIKSKKADQIVFLADVQDQKKITEILNSKVTDLSQTEKNRAKLINIINLIILLQY